MRERPTLSPGDPRHGTLNGYQHWLCRCDDCRRANAARSLARSRQHGVMPLADYKASILSPHGSRKRYERHGCRCRLCRDASRDWKRAQRAKRRSQVHA